MVQSYLCADTAKRPRAPNTGYPWHCLHFALIVKAALGILGTEQLYDGLPFPRGDGIWVVLRELEAVDIQEFEK